MNCIFCKIIKKEIPSKILYEDNDFIVIMDANPDSNGHILIIPIKHYKTFEDLDDLILLKINNLAKKMKDLLVDKLDIEGLTLATNYGINQMVKHYHLHLIPAYKEDLGLEDIDKIYHKIKDI
ncbi:MAG: HIT domain-containing protein [Bacilli bacterium]|nr:HIT domain-containing protein [Bacilli bacterium]MDD4795828.1 HIT domain-containing protein [Bacilli bacterium]